MRKTFCDGCGAECGPRIIRVHLAVTHQTNRAEPVAEDVYREIELCGEHGNQVSALLAAIGVDVTAYLKPYLDEPMPVRAVPL